MVLKQLARDKLTIERGRPGSKKSAAAASSSASPKGPVRRRTRGAAAAESSQDEVDGGDKSGSLPSDDFSEFTIDIEEEAFFTKV